MKINYILGGLALVGTLAVISYLRKPKRNSEGFFNAEGTRATCVKKNRNGSTTITTSMGDCPKGSVYVK